MTLRRYVLDDQRGDELEVEWQGNWNDVVVRFNRQVVVTFSNGDQLISGCDVELPDGSTIQLTARRRFGTADVLASQGDEPLRAVEVDAAGPLFIVYLVILAVGIFDIVGGTLAATLDVIFLKAMGFDTFSILVGATFVFLAILVRQGSSIALGLAVTLLAADALFGFVINRNFTTLYPYVGLLLRISAIYAASRGFKAIVQLTERHRVPITHFVTKEDD